MKNFLTMVRGLPFAMKVLLASTAARSLSFFAILAYMPIYLYDTVGMSGATVGYVIGGSVLVGTMASVYGGYLADRVTKINLVILLDLAIILLYLSLTVMHDPFTVTAVLLLTNIASSSMGVAAVPCSPIWCHPRTAPRCSPCAIRCRTSGRRWVPSWALPQSRSDRAGRSFSASP